MNLIKKVLEKMYLDKTFFKFIIVGVINTLVGSAIMFGCYNILNLSYWVSSVANYFFASILSYFLNKYYTFESKEKSFKSVVKFAVNIAVCYVFSYVIAREFINFVLSGLSEKFRDNIAMLIGMGLFVITNYFGQRLLVFEKDK